MGTRLKPNEPSVISEPMDSELVVINLESGCYYNLSPSAAKIWMKLESGATIDAIIQSQQTNDADQQEAAQEIDVFCRYLQYESLMVVVESDDIEVDCAAMDYEKPKIEKFSDMQEMLLLDPIHEVTEMGWPHEEKKS